MSAERDQQVVFARLVPRLIEQAFVLGYEVTGGEWWRTPEQAAWNAAHGIGIKNSLHRRRMAIDLNLFKNGVLLTKSEDYRPLGEWWEGQHPLARWGGRFGDGNHFSLEFGGVR
jgi:hypothetical protein